MCIYTIYTYVALLIGANNYCKDNCVCVPTIIVKATCT